MIISEVTLQGFRCFGLTTATVGLDSGLTVFIGDNGSGKTALMLALLRVLGPGRQSVVRQDFHVPPNEVEAPSKRTLSIELKLVFPELAEEGTDLPAVPEFFNQMTVDEDGVPVCRLRLEATWANDGTDEGMIDQQHYVVLPPDPGSGEAEKLLRFGAEDRAHLRMVYVPAVRDGTSHMTSFLRGRLWRAMRWTDNLRETLKMTGGKLNDAFLAEPGVARVSAQTAARWSDLYGGGTDSTPVLAPVDVRLGEFVRGVQMKFRPDESGGDRPLSELSDGQRSLFHISMTAAALDVESGITDPNETWDTDKLMRPVLTVVAVEEPENNLSPILPVADHPPAPGHRWPARRPGDHLQPLAEHPREDRPEPGPTLPNRGRPQRPDPQHRAAPRPRRRHQVCARSRTDLPRALFRQLRDPRRGKLRGGRHPPDRRGHGR